MILINENFLKLNDSYLFSEIAKRVNKYKVEHPNNKIISLGIGDVTMPLVPAVVDAMKKAILEMGEKKTFKGYGPEQGYGFLRKAISENEYKLKNIEIEENEIFVSDGAKCDTGNIVDVFGIDSTVAITDPVYPVYLDTNVMSGRKVIYLPLTENTGFIPEIPKEKVDIIYLCFPNNPTGTVLKKEELKKWVDYATYNKSIILFDAAYEAFITDNNIPHSIYEIEGAKKCSIEFRSFSKTAGFTGVRCAYTVIPKELIGYTKDKEKVSINLLWKRRQTTKFNGVSYITQKGAEAVYSIEGNKQIKEVIKYYLENAKIIKDGLKTYGYKVYGGENSPYIWMKIPKGITSWEFFDKLLFEKQIVGTPGSGFGKNGEGYFRLSAFGVRGDIIEAMKRF